MVHLVSIYQHKRWDVTNTTEQTYQNSAHITKWLKNSYALLEIVVSSCGDDPSVLF